MITTIFNHHNQLPPLEGLYQLGMSFDTFESRDAFVSQFPKSLRVYSGIATSYEISEITGNLEMKELPYASLFIQKTTNNNRSMNKVTGDVNESGLKRMERFYNAVKKQLEIESNPIY